MANVDYIQLDSPIRFPQSGLDWKDESGGAVTVPSRTLETGDTLEYQETGVVYTYDSTVYTWTGKSSGGASPLVVSLTWASPNEEFVKDNTVYAVTGVGTDGALTDGTTFKYQWYKQDPADNSSVVVDTQTSLDNFTSYTLADEDLGFVFWVSVEATDLDGNVATASTPQNGEAGAPPPVSQPEVILDELTPMYWYFANLPAGMLADATYYYNGVAYAQYNPTKSNEFYLYKSEDGGKTWVTIFDWNIHGNMYSYLNNGIGQHAVSFSCGNIYIAGTYNGYYSLDGGNSWISFDVNAITLNTQGFFADGNPDVSGVSKPTFILWKNANFGSNNNNITIYRNPGTDPGAPQNGWDSGTNVNLGVDFYTAHDSYYIRSNDSIGADNASGDVVNRLVITGSYRMNSGYAGVTTRLGYNNNSAFSNLGNVGNANGNGSTPFNLCFTNLGEDVTFFQTSVPQNTGPIFGANVTHFGKYNANNETYPSYDENMQTFSGLAGAVREDDSDGISIVASIGGTGSMGHAPLPKKISPDNSVWISSLSSKNRSTTTNHSVNPSGFYDDATARMVFIYKNNKMIIGSPFKITEFTPILSTYISNDFSTSSTFTVDDERSTPSGLNDGTTYIEYDLTFTDFFGNEDYLVAGSFIYQTVNDVTSQYEIMAVDISAKTMTIRKSPFIPEIDTNVSFFMEILPVVSTLI